MAEHSRLRQFISWGSKRRLIVAAAEFGRIQAANYAMAVALSALFSMFPLVLAILAITGLVLPDPARQAHVYHSVAGIFPASAQDEILAALRGVKHNAGILGVVSLIGLLWTGSSLFMSLEFALSKVFDYNLRNALKQRLMGLLMIIGFGIGVVAVVGTNAAIAALGEVGPSIVRLALAVAVGSLILIAACISIYRWVPNRSFTIGQVLPGGLLAGLAMEGISLLFPLYVNVAHGFNTYGQQFGLFFLLATWMTLLAQVLLFGAVFNKVAKRSADAADLPHHDRA